MGNKPGPARSASARDAILKAAAEELGECGFDRFSIDKVARRAGSSKQTIYRWYASKSALVSECVLLGYLWTPDVVVPETDSVRSDIIGWMKEFAEHSSNPNLAAQLRAASAASAENEDIAEQFRASVVEKTERALTTRLERGMSAGHLAVSIPASTLAQAIVGALLFKVLARQPITERFVDELGSLLIPA